MVLVDAIHACAHGNKFAWDHRLKRSDKMHPIEAVEARSEEKPSQIHKTYPDSIQSNTAL